MREGATCMHITHHPRQQGAKRLARHETFGTILQDPGYSSADPNHHRKR